MRNMPLPTEQWRFPVRGRKGEKRRWGWRGFNDGASNRELCNVKEEFAIARGDFIGDVDGLETSEYDTSIDPSVAAAQILEALDGAARTGLRHCKTGEEAAVSAVMSEWRRLCVREGWGQLEEAQDTPPIWEGDDLDILSRDDEENGRSRAGTGLCITVKSLHTSDSHQSIVSRNSSRPGSCVGLTASTSTLAYHFPQTTAPVSPQPPSPIMVRPPEGTRRLTETGGRKGKAIAAFQQPKMIFVNPSAHTRAAASGSEVPMPDPASYGSAWYCKPSRWKLLEAAKKEGRNDHSARRENPVKRLSRDEAAVVADLHERSSAAEAALPSLQIAADFAEHLNTQGHRLPDFLIRARRSGGVVESGPMISNGGGDFLGNTAQTNLTAS